MVNFREALGRHGASTLFIFSAGVLLFSFVFLFCLFVFVFRDWHNLSGENDLAANLLELYAT